MAKIRNYLANLFIDNPDLIPKNNFISLSEFVDYLYIIIFRKGNKQLSENVIKKELITYQKLLSSVTPR
jgi:hypothetical protein